MAIGLFDVLKAMSMNNKNIKAAYLSENMKAAKMGRDGWGDITIAVDNQAVQDLLTNQPRQGILVFWDTTEYAAVKAELEHGEAA